MTANRLPEIVKKAERLTVDIENAVRGFARYHKYSIGADMRSASMLVVKVCHRAWRDRGCQAQWVEKLVWVVDELKLVLQLASQLKAFKSFNQFENVIRQTDDIGRSAGGWKRSLHGKSQNSAVIKTQESAQILSDRYTSMSGLENRQHHATQRDA